MQSIETARLQIIAQFNGHRIIAQRSKDFVDLADLLLVLQEDGSVEVWNIIDLHFADQIILARIVHDAEGDDSFWGTNIETSTATSAAATTESATASTTWKTIKF